MKPPKILDKIADKVLAYRPKPKSKPARKRAKRRKNAQRVIYIIPNEKYVGRYVWNRSQFVKDPDSGKRLRRERPESEWIIRRCEPIVDQDVWNICQGRFKTLSPHTRGQKYLLSGLLECGLCGSKLVIVGGAGRRYRCGGNHYGGNHACANSHSFSQGIAEGLILKPVVDVLLSDEAVDAGIKEMRRSDVPLQPTHADRELVELERLVETGVLSPDVAAPSIAAAKKKIEVAAATAQLERPRSIFTPATWRKTVSNMKTILQGDDVLAAREVLKGLIGPISCVPSGNHMIATLAALEVRLRSGRSSGSCGSGGAIRNSKHTYHDASSGPQDEYRPAHHRPGNVDGAVRIPVRSFGPSPTTLRFNISTP